MARQSCMARAARTARAGSSSRACRAPNTAIMASPMCFSTVPPWALIKASSRCQSELMCACRSSGSCRSANDVKPEKSANRTVTCLRWPASNPAGAGTGAKLAAALDLAAWPQAGQNRASVGKNSPQLAQRAGRSAPHLKQTRASTGASVPQAWQCIGPAIPTALGMRLER
ncbi:hypothetical protein SBV1_420007 [Verrucomicrobia bacterium]|nr:hypothetical protein SBV1_420007 [Verrucomicrobiota bacterium]